MPRLTSQSWPQSADGEAAVARRGASVPAATWCSWTSECRVLDGLAGDGAASPPIPALADTRVVVLTTFELDEYVFGALRAGASGFLLKDLEPDELITAVRVVAGGEALLAPRHTRRLIEAFVAGPVAEPPAELGERIASLTPREREVLGLVGRGASNAEIADALVLSPLTAKTHVARLFAKLPARDRAQLVVLAYESGLVRPGYAA